jgi:hypothetical protein
VRFAAAGDFHREKAGYRRSFAGSSHTAMAAACAEAGSKAPRRRSRKERGRRSCFERGGSRSSAGSRTMSFVRRVRRGKRFPRWGSVAVARRSRGSPESSFAMRFAFFCGGDRRWMRIPMSRMTKACGWNAWRVFAPSSGRGAVIDRDERCRRSVRDRTRFRISNSKRCRAQVRTTSRKCFSIQALRKRFGAVKTKRSADGKCRSALEPGLELLEVSRCFSSSKRASVGSRPRPREPSRARGRPSFNTLEQRCQRERTKPTKQNERTRYPRKQDESVRRGKAKRKSWTRGAREYAPSTPDIPGAERTRTG